MAPFFGKGTKVKIPSQIKPHSIFVSIYSWLFLCLIYIFKYLGELQFSFYNHQLGWIIILLNFFNKIKVLSQDITAKNIWYYGISIEFKALYTVSFDWFLFGLEWIIILEFYLLKLLIFYQKYYRTSDLSLTFPHFEFLSLYLDIFHQN